MNDKRKPDIKVFFKSKSDGSYVDFAAFWKNDDGRLGGGLDKRITRVKIEYEDGSTKLIDARDKKNPSHYCNAFSGQATQRTAKREGPKPSRNDDGDDDIPFD